MVRLAIVRAAPSHVGRLDRVNMQLINWLELVESGKEEAKAIIILSAAIIPTSSSYSNNEGLHLSLCSIAGVFA